MLAATALPPAVQDWFAARGWSPRRHQLEMLAKAPPGPQRPADRADRRRQDPGGLPAQPDRALRAPAAQHARPGVHTLYISPLKALAVDVERNLMTPIREMGLKIVAESRTGDTKQAASSASGSGRPTSC
jgi:ATP-dependent Lhr-like helicase